MTAKMVEDHNYDNRYFLDNDELYDNNTEAETINALFERTRFHDGYDIDASKAEALIIQNKIVSMDVPFGDENYNYFVIYNQNYEPENVSKIINHIIIDTQVEVNATSLTRPFSLTMDRLDQGEDKLFRKPSPKLRTVAERDTK